MGAKIHSFYFYASLFLKNFNPFLIHIEYQEVRLKKVCLTNTNTLLYFFLYQQKNSVTNIVTEFCIKKAATYSPTSAVPSALMGLTSLFGMVRGEPHCYNHLKSLGSGVMGLRA